MQTSSVMAPSIFVLIVDIIKSMNPAKLALPPKEPGISLGTPPVDWYDKEFYRASEKITPGSILWSPQWGSAGVDKGGLVDYYLQDKKWALELLREGNRARSHCERFLSGGNYHDWILGGDVVDWAVIDFGTSQPGAPHPGQSRDLHHLIEQANEFLEFPNLYHVCFAANFETVAILDNLLKVIEQFPLYYE